ncbi:MAG: Wzz/FepE/Etk N-terminal domain-containing protein, partial [Oscillospiraceae bacterium]|nr:Wzz/FepE/Etk N-terminal domain-containing protein [Oscillospiraceae bacterium]
MTNNQTGRDVVEIDLLELAQVLLRRIGIIILCTVLAGGIAFGYTYNFVEPMYTASAMMYVNNSDISVGSTSISLSSTDVTVGQNLVSTYAVIAKSRTVLEDVIETEDLEYSYGTMYNMITISSLDDTAIFQISVTSTS